MTTERKSVRSSKAWIFAARHRFSGKSIVVLTVRSRLSGIVQSSSREIIAGRMVDVNTGTCQVSSPALVLADIAI
jgi:hypothetical protein